MSNNAKRVLFRKGTTSDHQLFTGARGEITVDVTRNIAIVHNGITTGGHELVGVAATGQSITNKDSIGIGTAIADSALTVEGDARVSGIVTTNSLDAVNILVGILTGTDNNIISLSTSIIPNVNETYDLGSLTNRFRDLYLSGNTLKLGDASFSSSSETLSLSGVGLGVSHLNAESLNITGIATFQHVDLNNVSVVGVSTFIGTTEVKDSSFKVTNSSASGHYLQITQNANASLNLDKVGDGDFFIGGNNIYLKNDGNNEVYAGFEANSRSYLNYDGSTKLETTASGIDVDGHTELDNVNVSGATTTASLNVTGTSLFQGNVDLSDNVNLRIGTGNDLQLYHDSNNSYISNIVGNLYITDNGGSIFVQPQSGENSAVFNGNTSVELYYNGAKKFETSIAGVGVTGNLVVTGNVVATTLSGSLPTTDLAGTIANTQLAGSIPYAKLQNVSNTSRILGRDSAGAGVIEEITPANLRTMLGIEAGATADQTKADIDALNINASTSTKAYVTESDGDTVNRGLVFCDAANNASGNKDLKYDRNLTYNASSNTLYTTKFQGTEVNISTISLGGSTGTNGQYIKSTGSGATWSQVDATTLGGLNLHTGRNDDANKVVRTQGNGYCEFGWINTTSGAHTSTVTKVYSTYTTDGYIRYCTPNHLANSMTNVLHSDAADTFSGDLTSSGSARILLKKTDNNVSDHIIFYNGTTRMGEIGCEDTTWLRINQETDKNIYTPRYIRADAGFFVDGTTKGINGSGNFIGGTIAGASDYGTLLRSNADDSASGTITFNGRVNIRGHIDLSDNEYLYFGSGDDVEMFCNGSHMYMDLNSGIGNFYIRDGSTTRFTFDDNGSFTASSNVTAYSDITLKKNIEVIPNALDKVMQLRGVTFDRKDIETSRQSGVIAQEVEKVLPEVVATNDEGIKSVAYGNMVGLLIEAIKEQQQQIDELKRKLEEK